MSKGYPFDIELNTLMSAGSRGSDLLQPTPAPSSSSSSLEQRMNLLNLKLKQQQQQSSLTASSIAQQQQQLLASALSARSKARSGILNIVDPATRMPIDFPGRSMSPPNSAGFSSSSGQFDLNSLLQMSSSAVSPTQSKPMDVLNAMKQPQNLNPSIQGFPKKISKTETDILALLAHQHQQKLQMQASSQPQPFPKGRSIVKQNNHWPEASSNHSSSLDFGSNRNNFSEMSQSYGMGGGGGGSSGQQQKPFRNGVDSGMYDFGGEFSATTPPARDIFSQAASSAGNGFPPIGTFSMENSSSSSNNFGSKDMNRNKLMKVDPDTGNTIYGDAGVFGQTNGTDTNNVGTQETGIIEKLLHSYGFIQCCERQARLFFHFSQFCGNIEHLKIGDPVEFEMTYDRRTGKPIACSVKKIAPEVVLSEERVTGTVTTEIKQDGVGSSETTGRISYENRGECFFLPYTKDDVEGNVTLCAGDKVSFQVATNQRGNLGACHIRLENPVHPVKYRGVVCSMKESFGFIERADVVKEIFFHFSEADQMELRPGDDVEFIIQTRNGKEVACNLTRLAPGSIIFEDVGTEIYRGQVLKPLDRNNPNRQVSDPLPGRIRYRAADHSEKEVPFGDKDQKGDFTLRHGDWVQFLLATDRRDLLQRGTTISLLDETFEVSGEKREQGVVAALKEGFGFIRCVERSTRLFFHFAEVLDTSREICVGDEVEFTVVQDPASSFGNNRQNAIRIKHLAEGSVQFETLVESSIEGVVTREAPKSPIKSQERTEGGVISYGQEKTIMYFLKDCDKIPRKGDNIRFDICQVKRNKELIAVNIKEISATAGAVGSPTTNKEKASNGNALKNGTSNGTGGPVYQGFIAVLKENFGFIETLDHDEEIFFHFSNFFGSTNTLELGQEVEYTLSNRGSNTNGGNCMPAENVKILPKGTIAQPKVIDTVYNGTVDRPLRCINPDQAEYCGLINLLGDHGKVVSTHEFGITSLVNKRDMLQKNDVVSFKLDENKRAVELNAIRQKKRATVDSIKGPFGFLDFEVEEGKKLFFHMSEVHGNSNNLHQGDTVEFSIVTNQRNGKSSACNVVKVVDGVISANRPERLLIRLKFSSMDENGPRLTVIRTPKGPDGTRGFAAFHRTPKIPGIAAE